MKSTNLMHEVDYDQYVKKKQSPFFIITSQSISNGVEHSGHSSESLIGCYAMYGCARMLIFTYRCKKKVDAKSIKCDT